MLCGDEAYRCFGVETWCAEAGESRGVVRVRGGVTPSGKAGRRGDRGRLQAVTGDLHFSVTMSYLRCRKNDFSEIYGVGMMSHILRCNFALFIRFEIIKKKEHRFGRIFSPKRRSFVLYFWMLQKLLHRYGILTLCPLKKDKNLL